MNLIGVMRQENYLNQWSFPLWLTAAFVAIVATLTLDPGLAAAADGQVAEAVAKPDPAPTGQTPSAAGGASPDAESLPDYSAKSDYQLTELGARWDELSRPERDALLREVKLRMAQRRDSDGVLMIRTQRRYGRVYRSDGRYLKIETKVVRVRPAKPDGTGPGFGTGFEQRTAKAGSAADADEAPVSGQRGEGVIQSSPAVSAPTVRVTDPTH